MDFTIMRNPNFGSLYRSVRYRNADVCVTDIYLVSGARPGWEMHVDNKMGNSYGIPTIRVSGAVSNDRWSGKGNYYVYRTDCSWKRIAVYIDIDDDANCFSLVRFGYSDGIVYADVRLCGMEYRLAVGSERRSRYLYYEKEIRPAIDDIQSAFQLNLAISNRKEVKKSLCTLDRVASLVSRAREAVSGYSATRSVSGVLRYDEEGSESKEVLSMYRNRK